MRCSHHLLFLGLLLATLNNVTPADDCSPGYGKTSKGCVDENECEDPVCGVNAVCYNTMGSYYCQCEQGYWTEKTHKVNFTQDSGGQCVDINECREINTICGLNAECTNVAGSYYCTCDPGFVASDMNKSFRDQGVKCNELQCDRLETETSVPLLNNILKELKSKCLEKDVAAKDMLQILLEALGSFLADTSFNDSKMITALFEVVENTLPLVGQLQVEPYISDTDHATVPQTRVEMLVKRNTSAPGGAFSLSTNNVKFNSPWKTAAGEPYLGFASASLLEYNSLKSPHKSVYINKSENPKAEFELISKVVTIAVTNPKTDHLKEPITLNFTHLQDAKRNTTCVFWDSKLNNGSWSTRGCEVKQTSISHTVCSCSHLSSFAVLMALYELDDVFELQLITWIGLSLSLICLLICILTFWLVRSIQSTRTTIHLHLCISLFIADLIFLVGISQTDNKVGCGVVAGLLHFFFLAVFCWMCLEGVQLFRMVVLVFNTTLSRAYLMAGGYGVPALIVIISASINYRGYGTSRYCWLSLENGFIWSFFGPVCIIIVVNAVFFMITVSKLAQKFNSLNPDLSSLRKIKAFTITAIAQLCVLGTMWIFGCFQFDKGMLVMSYVFTILNSLQGVLVFITHCLLSKPVRDEYIRFLTCLTIQQKRSYSEFSTNQSSKSQMSKSIQNTGESKI